MLDGIKLEDHPLRSGPATLGVMLGKAPSLFCFGFNSSWALYRYVHVSELYTQGECLQIVSLYVSNTHKKAFALRSIPLH